MKTVFVHPERCIGCKQCEIACAVAHSRSKSPFWAVFEDPPPTPRIHAEPGPSLNTAFPNKCHHCNPAPCIGVCPTAAIHRAEADLDIVVIDAKKCIACGMCAMVCPFDVITYRVSQDAPYKSAVAMKCDHCIERQRDGLIPACVEVCKVNALQFGEINELVKKARTRIAEKVSAAVGQIPSEIVAPPEQIVNWRAWGAAVSHLNADGSSQKERKS
jgi:carbon-monoxide dehydrogenase iron sulfur subunit